jgi:hypothetical protein
MRENILLDSSSHKGCMSIEPLPDDVVVRLRSDPTAALAGVRSKVMQSCGTAW